MSRLNIKSVVILVIILLGLVLSVYGTLNYQNILSRAGSTDYTSFEVKDIQGNTLTPRGEGVYDTQSLEVKLQIKDLEKLSE